MNFDLRAHRKQVGIALGAVAVVAVVGGGLMLAAGGSKAQPSPSTIASVLPSESPTATPSATPSAEPSPSDSGSPEASGPTLPPIDWVYSDLDGVLTDPTLAHRLPIAIMIDDNTVARPQSGFNAASIVYQAPADGGEDRYMMVFQEGSSPDIGPVRSARPYFVQWAAEYKAGFGHFGGDITSLRTTVPTLIKSGSIYNMDDLAGFGCAYHRVTTRAAPHNAYTNTGELLRCAAKVPYPTTFQKVPTRPFTADTPAAQLPKAGANTVTIPYPTNKVEYLFDASRDAYVRKVRDVVQVDPADNNQWVYARNIIVLYQPLAYDAKVDPGHNRPIVGDIGSGQAMVFMEGKAIKATWKKPNATSLTRVYDAAGKEIPLVRGRIFIQVVPTGTKVTWG